MGRTHTAVYRRAILIMIESGSLYALTQIIQLSWYVAKFPGLYFVSDSFVQIMVSIPPLGDNCSALRCTDSRGP